MMRIVKMLKNIKQCPVFEMSSQCSQCWLNWCLTATDEISLSSHRDKSTEDSRQMVHKCNNGAFALGSITNLFLKHY